MSNARIENLTEKIAKLLALAEGAATEAEAAVAMGKAQELATQHSIDLAVARAAGERGARREEPIHRNIKVGKKRQHTNTPNILLFSAVGGPQGVRIDIAHDSTYVIAYGFPSDIDLVEQMWASLAVQMAGFAEDYLAKGEWRSETVYRSKTVEEYDLFLGRNRKRKVWGDYPITKQSARRSFQEGFIGRIGQRLREAAEETEKRAETALEAGSGASSSSGSVALALREKNAEVAEHYRTASRARGSWRGASGGSGRSGAAVAAGRSAANRANLSGGSQRAVNAA